MPPNATLAQKVDWCVASIRVLADASRFEGSTIADPITITNAPNPPVSAFDPTTATLPQVANCLATVLRDMQRRGRQNRAS
jgi:hypothetical protein